MSLFGLVGQFTASNKRVVIAIQTSVVIFLLFCCRYMDSFIDMYHVVGDLMLCHQPVLDWMAIKRSST